MIRYAEYVQGKEKYRDMIAMSPVIDVLDPEGYYPVVPIRDDDEVFEIAEVLRLEKKQCKVYERFGADPTIMDLYVEDWMGYEVEITDGSIEEG